MSPPYLLPMVVAVGIVTLGLYVVNAVFVVLQMRDATGGPKMSCLRKWSWGISLASMLASCLAPISLLMACVDLTKTYKATSSTPHPRRMATLALVNSISALVCFMVIFGASGRRWTAYGTILRYGASLDRDPRFAATRIDHTLLKEYWHPGNGSWSPVNGMRCLTPITVLDFPNALICDAVLLPWDWRQFNKNRADEEFWRAVLFGSRAPPPTSQCVDHCTPYTMNIINHEVYNDYQGHIPSTVIALLVELARDPNGVTRGISLEGLSGHKNLTSNTWMSIYDVARNRPPNFTPLATLARNSCMPLEMFPVLAKHPSYDVRRSVAINSATPAEVLQTLERDARTCIEREKAKASPSWWDINNSQRIIDSMQKYKRTSVANQPTEGTR